MKKIREGVFSFNGSAWTNVSKGAKDFVTRLLTYEKEERPSALDAFRDPWILEMGNMDVE